MRRSIRSVASLAAGAALLALAAPAALAWPGCKEAVASTRTGGDPAAAYNLAILVMVSLPFLLTAGVAGYLWRLQRGAERAAREAAAVL